MQELAKNASKDRLLKLIYSLSQLENDMKWSLQKTIIFQTGIIKVCMGEQTDGIDELRKKILVLEDKITSGKINVNGINVIENNIPSKSIQLPKKDVVKENIKEKNTVEKDLVEKNENKILPNNGSSKNQINWQNIINIFRNTGKVRLFTSLVNTRINQVGDLIIEIIFPNGLTPFVKSVLEDNSNKKDLLDVLYKETGKEWHVKYVDGSSTNTETVKNKNSISDLGIDVNIIE